MKQKTYLSVACFVFSLVTIMHGLRLLNGWQVQFGGYTVPMWFSWIGVFLAGYLAFSAYQLNSKK